MCSPLSGIVLDSNSIMYALIFGVPVASVLGGFWYKLNKVRSEHDLKRSLVERGMSAEEIERVLAAGGTKDDEDD